MQPTSSLTNSKSIVSITAMLALLAAGLFLWGEAGESSGLNWTRACDEPSVAETESDPSNLPSRALSGGPKSVPEFEVRDSSRIAAEAPKQEPNATVRLTTVAWPDGQRLPNIVVKLCDKSHDGAALRSRTDGDGRVTLAVPPGTYCVRVGGADMPAGFLPPPLQDVPKTNPELGIHAPIVLAVAEGDVELEVPVPRSCRIYGRVLGLDHVGLAGVEVQASCVEVGHLGVKQLTKTDGLGAYSLEVVPGVYRLRTVFLGSQPQGSTRMRPRPVDIRVDATEERLVDLQVPQGNAIITGRLFDPGLLPGEEDVTWEGLQVLLLPWVRERELEAGILGMKLNDAISSTRSNADGRFRFQGVPAGTYKLSFSPHEGYLPHSKDSILGRWPKGRVVDVLEGEAADLGDCLVPRARPTSVTGTVHLEGVGPHAAVVGEVEYNRQTGAESGVRVSVGVDAEGKFKFFVHPSTEGLPEILRLRLSTDREWRLVHEFYPQLGGVTLLDLAME